MNCDSFKDCLNATFNRIPIENLDSSNYRKNSKIWDTSNNCHNCPEVNSGLTSHQQRGHTETGPRFKVSSERPEKRGIDLAIPGLVV